MNVYTCTDHDGHYVGVASVIVANHDAEAAYLLARALEQQGLSGEGFTLQKVDLTKPQALILQNGDY